MAGGNKFDDGKPPMALLDRYALEQTALVLAYGAKRYGEFNWRDGITQLRLVGAALRHLFQHLDGEDLDSDTNLPHLAHAMCEIMFALRMLKDRPDMDDRYRPTEGVRKHPKRDGEPKTIFVNKEVDQFLKNGGKL